MSRKHNAWSEANIQHLLDILIFDPDTNQCLNYKEAGEEFDIKAASIKRVVIILRKQGVLPKYDASKQRDNYLRPYTNDELIRISGAFNSGASLEEVAEMFGRPVNGMRCIRANLAREGRINFHFKKWTKLQTETLIVNWQSDRYFITENVAELVRMTGHPESSVYCKIGELRNKGLLPKNKRIAPPESMIKKRIKWHNEAMSSVFNGGHYGQV